MSDLKKYIEGKNNYLFAIILFSTGISIYQTSVKSVVSERFVGTKEFERIA